MRQVAGVVDRRSRNHASLGIDDAVNESRFGARSDLPDFTHQIGEVVLPDPGGIHGETHDLGEVLSIDVGVGQLRHDVIRHITHVQHHGRQLAAAPHRPRRSP
jgi:hypothetical protein